MKKILFFLLASTSCVAQNLDSGFGFNNSGIANHRMSFISSKQLVYDAVLQPDGKTVCIGRFSTNYAGPSTNFIARYNADGTFDRSFNQKGWRSGTGVYIQAVSLQSDGKILTASGRTLSRFLANGDLDSSFNTTGTKTIVTGSVNMNIKAIIEQPDNKIVLVGYVSNGANNDFIAVRLNTDGSNDTTFDSDGIVTLPIGTGHDEAFSVKLQSDNKIILAGQSIVGGAYDFALARLNTNGSLDTSFGTNGTQTMAISTGIDYGRSLDILANGKIVMVGTAAGKLGVAKFNSDGTPDTNFGSANGKIISTENISVTFTNTATALHNMPKVKAMADDKLVISLTSDSNVSLIKYLANGSATDATFASNGIRTFDSGGTDIATYLHIKPDNTITAGGYYSDLSLDYKATKWDVDTNGNNAAYYNPAALYKGFDTTKDIALLPNGKYLILVDTPVPSIRLYNANGSVDLSFGPDGDGIITLPADDYSYKMIVQNDSKILISGNETIKRLNTDGTLDNTFGVNGIVNLYEVTSGEINFVDNIHLLQNGKILVAADYDNTSDSFSTPSFGLMRLNTDGTIDTSFGTNGLFTTRFNADQTIYDEYPREIIVQSDGKIIALGVTYNNTIVPYQYNMCGFRVNPNGTLDTAFGTNGKMDLQLNTINYPYASLVLADDKFLVATKINSDTKTFKLTANGQLDTTFGTNGIADDAAGTINYSALSLQPDGKFIKAGTKNSHVSMSRYNSDGSIDNSFGVNNNGEMGLIMYNNSKATKTIIQSDNKLVVLGETYKTQMVGGDENANFIARYTNLQLGTLAFENQNNALLVYPNPIQNEATFEYTLENNETVSVELIDLQGRIVKKVISNENQLAGKHELPLTLDAKINPGNYFLTISTAKGKQSVQILKK